MTAEVRVGVDVGGSSTEAVAFGPGDRVLARSVHDTRPSGDGVVATVVAAVRGALAGVPAAGGGGLDVVRAVGGARQGIGVGVPGQVDPEAGTVSLAVNLGIDGTPYPLAAAVADQLGRPVVLENDVRAAALGASLALGVTGSLALLAIGTGISAGLVVDGRIRRGRDGMAGEIGHAPVAAGPRCACGLDGCLEALAAGPAIAAAWPQGGDRSADDLFAAALAGDPDAVDAAAPIIRHLTTGVTLALADLGARRPGPGRWRRRHPGPADPCSRPSSPSEPRAPTSRAACWTPIDSSPCPRSSPPARSGRPRWPPFEPE